MAQFDPSKPFTIVDEPENEFDPNKPFSIVEEPKAPEQKEEPVPFMDSTRRDRLNLRLGLEPTEPEALTKEQLDVGGFNWEKDYERATRNMDSIDALLKKAEAHQAKIDEWLNNPGEDEEFNEQKKRHQLTLDAIEDFEREQQDFLKRYTPTKEQYDHIVGLTKTHNAANPKKLKTPEEIAWENKGMRGMLFARDGDGFEGVRIGGNNRDAVLMAHLDVARKDPEPLWWVEKLPIAGGIVSYVDSWKKSKSAKLLEQSPPKGFGYHLTGKGEKPQPEDWDAIMEYSRALKDMAQYIAYAEAQEDKGWLNKVGDITASLPGYAVEFWLTGPVGAAAKAGTTKLGQKVITEAMQKKMATSFAGRVGIRAGQAGRYTVAAGAQTLANPWMIARNLGQEMEAGITVGQDPATGNMTYALDGESMPINLSRAYAYSLAEIGTERLGEVIQSTKAFKAMRGAFSKSKELNPALTPRAFMEQANKAGYQGFALELAEERANELSTYVYDVLGGKEEFTRESLDRRFTSPLEKDFYAELASFALFGAGMKMGQTGVNQAQLELAKTDLGATLLGFDRKQWTAEKAAKKIQSSDELQNLQGHTGRVVLFEDGNTGKVVAVKVGSEAEETTSGIIQAWAQNNNLKIRGVYHMKAGVPSEVFTATWNQSDGQKQHTFNSVEDARAYAQSLMELGNQEAAKSVMDQAYQSMQPPSEIDALDMKDSGVINRVRLGKARVKLSEVQGMLGGQVTETDLGYKAQFDNGTKLHINFQELPFNADSILVSALSMGAVTQEDINQADTQEKREALARSVSPAGFFTQIEINGKPIDNNYLIQLDLNADSATFRHETMHFFRETGVISEKQWDSITDRVAPKKKEELRKAKEDQAPEKVIRELDRSIEEDVARIVEGRTDTRLPGESRLIDEVIKLLDKLRNLTRYVNTRSLWRGMESGQFAGVAPKKGSREDRLESLESDISLSYSVQRVTDEAFVDKLSRFSSKDLGKAFVSRDMDGERVAVRLNVDAKLRSGKQALKDRGISTAAIKKYGHLNAALKALDSEVADEIRAELFEANSVQELKSQNQFGAFLGKVLSYDSEIELDNVTFGVDQSAWARAVKNDQKNVHAGVIGTVNANRRPNRRNKQRIFFIPHVANLFFDGNGRAVKGAAKASMIGGQLYASGLEYFKEGEAPIPKDKKLRKLTPKHSIQKAPEGFRDMDHWVSTLKSLSTLGNQLTPGAKENLSVPDDPQGALQTLIDSTDVPEVKEAAKTLQKIFEGQPVEKRTKVQAVDQKEKNFAGVYWLYEDEVKLVKGGHTDLVLMHELVHAASSRVLDQYTNNLRKGFVASRRTGTNYIKRLKGLRDQIVSGVRSVPPKSTGAKPDLPKPGGAYTRPPVPKEKITPSDKDLLVARIIDAYIEAVDKMGPKELVGHELKNTPTISVIKKEDDAHHRMVISNPGKPGAYDLVKKRHDLFRKIVGKAGLGRGDYFTDMGSFFLTENAVKHLQQKGEEGALKNFQKANHQTEVLRFDHTEKKRKKGIANTRKVVDEIGKRYYGFQNLGEFLAEAASNPAFMMQLAQIDLGEATEVKGWMTPGAKLRDRTAKSIRGLMASNFMIDLPPIPTGPGYANPLPPPSGYKPEHILEAERTLKKIEGRHTMLDEVAHIIADFHETKKPGDKYHTQPARYPMYSVQGKRGNFDQLPDGRLIGYRVSRYHGGKAVSGADSRQSSGVEEGEIISFKGQGVFISNSPEYVTDYYAVHDVNILQKVAFSENDITFGDVFGKEPELSVKKAEVISSEIFEDGETPSKFQPSSDDIRYSVQGGFEGEMTVANIPAQSQFGQMYSRVAEAIREMPLKKATFSKWMGRLEKLSKSTPKVYRMPENFPAGERAFAKEELEELGIDTLFSPGQELTKEEVLEMVESTSMPKIDFTISGDWALMGTKYEGLSRDQLVDARERLIDDHFFANAPVFALREAIYGKDTALNNRESLVLNHYTGLEDGVKRSVEEIAEQVGVSADRVRTILIKGRQKIRNTPELQELYYAGSKNVKEVKFINSLLQQFQTEHESTNLPGATGKHDIGYGELIWQQPGIGYRPPSYHELPDDTVAHARFNYNEEQLDLIESQSDLHQLGDKEGYKSPHKFRNTKWESVTPPEKAEEYLKKGKEAWGIIEKDIQTATKAHLNATEENKERWKEWLEDTVNKQENFTWFVSRHVSEEVDVNGNPLFLEKRLIYNGLDKMVEAFEFHRTDSNVLNEPHWVSHIATSIAENVEGAIEQWRESYYKNYGDGGLVPRATHVNNWNELNFRAVVQAAAIQGKKYVAFPSHWTQVAMIEGHPYHPSQEPGAVGVDRTEDFMPQNRNEPPKGKTAMYTRMVFGTLNEAKRMAKKYGTKIVKREALGGRHLPSNDDIISYFSGSNRRADELYHIIDANQEHFHDLAVAMYGNYQDPDSSAGSEDTRLWKWVVDNQGDGDVSGAYNTVMRDNYADMDIDVLTEIIEANDLLSLKHPDGGTVAEFFTKDQRFGGRYGKPIIFNALEVSPRMAGPIARYSVQKKLPNLNTPEFFQTPLAIEGTGKNGRISINDVAGALEDYTLGKHKKPLTDDELGLAALFVNAKDEVAFQLEQPVSGRDFYHQHQVVLEKYLQKIHPELKQKHNMVLFKALLSPTSFGQNPKNNVVSAVKIWESGKLGDLQPYQPGGKGWTLRGDIVAGMVEMHNRLVQDMGPKKAAKWLTSEHFIGNPSKPQPGTLRYYNNNVSGKQGDKVLGGYIWGPKGGPFFFNNIGIQDKVTMDMWFSRSWNRIMGTLIENGEIVEAPRNDAERDTMIGVVDKLSKDLGLTHEEVQAVWWFYEQQLWQALGANVKSLTFVDGAEAVLESKGVQLPKVRGYNRAAAKGRQAAQSKAISRGGKHSVQVTPESQARINNIEAAGAYRSPDPEVAPAYGSSYISDFQKRHLARASQKLIYFAGSKAGQEKGVLQIEEAYAAAAVRKSQAELTRQLTDAAYKSQPGLKLPQWMQVGKWASRLRDFMGISLPLAAHLNATNRDNQGNFIFADFEMRAGLMSEKDFRQGKHQIGDKILVMNNLTKENDELVVGAFISTPDGRSGYQLLRTMTADRQAEIYNHFKREYSDLIWAVDMYIDPALRGTRNVVNGVEIPAFNRFSIEEMMAESDDGFQAVAGYTPDVVATRSLIGGILGLFNPGAGSRSPGRKYKTGKGRESGNVQDLFSGHSIRAFQMLQEKHRQRFRDAVLKYAAKPLAEGESPTNLPEGWVMLDTGMNDLIQRVKKFRQFIEDETTEGTDFYKKFLGELYAKRGRQLKIRREAVEVLMQQYIRIQFNNRLYNMGAWLIRNSKGLLLAHPGTMVVNAATNDLFTMEAAFQELLKGITLLPVNPSEGQVSLRMAKELFVGNFMHRFPSLRKMAGIETHYDQVVEEAIPEEVFASSVSLQDLDVKYEVSASQYLREGELGAAALQLLQYGNIDVRAKQRMTYAFLKAHAVQAAKDQGLKAQAMRDFVDRFMKNPPRDLMAKAADAANLEFLNYADSPAWLQWFSATPYTAVIMPFPRFGYHFMAKQITKAAAVKDVIGKVPAEKRADAFGKLMAFSMFGLGGTGLILDMLLRDDDDEEDEARERIGTNYVKYTDPVTGEPRTKQIDREMITTARVNISWYARQMGLGTEGEDDFWLRVRNYPMIAMGGNLILAESDAKNHGAWEGAKTYIRNTADLSKDFFSVGAGVKVPTKIWAEINSEPGSQKKAPAFDPYATNVPLGFYLVEQTASTLVPGTRQLNDLSVLIEPARPKKTESKTLEYKPGPWEAVRANHVGAVLSRWAEKEGLIEPMPRQGSVVTMAITGQPGDSLERRIQRIEGLSKLEGPEANIFLDPRSYRPRLATISEQSIPERTRSLELLRIMGLNLKPVPRGAYEEQIKPNPQLPSSGY